MTAFKYRFVRFGTRFTSADGPRPNRSADPAALFENELAVDVGSICWGFDGETLAVLDHHFHRPAGQFPSAAAAVLHNADSIRERLGSFDDEVWLVSHQQPDFDAFSAMYLARQIVAGDVPAAGWEEFGICKGSWCVGPQAIDWFQPRTDNLPPNRRWPVLMAANAACVDHCRRMSCPKNRSLHSILYAALLRGRNYLSETSGAFEFFEEVRQALLDPDLRLNPLHDSVLEGTKRFAPELALLDRETEAYRRDIARARKSIVFLQSAKGKFADWYGEVAKLRLLDANDQPAVRHLHPLQQSQSQADGIYSAIPSACCSRNGSVTISTIHRWGAVSSSRRLPTPTSTPVRRRTIWPTTSLLIRSGLASGTSITCGCGWNQPRFRPSAARSSSIYVTIWRRPTISPAKRIRSRERPAEPDSPIVPVPSCVTCSTIPGSTGAITTARSSWPLIAARSSGLPESSRISATIRS